MSETEESIVFNQGRINARMGGEEATCKFACAYCFVNIPGYELLTDITSPNGQVELRYTIEQKGVVELIQPDCETEFIQRPGWFEELMELADYGIPISIATKSALTLKQVQQLQEVDYKLRDQGAILNVAVSITTLNPQLWHDIERGTPPPERRLKTLEDLHAVDIFTSVAIRPTLPLSLVTSEEYHQLIQRVKDIEQSGIMPLPISILTGDLYMTSDMAQYMDIHAPGYAIEYRQVDWMKKGETVPVVSTQDAISVVKQHASQYMLQVFDSNIALIDNQYSQNNELWYGHHQKLNNNVLPSELAFSDSPFNKPKLPYFDSLASTEE